MLATTIVPPTFPRPRRRLLRNTPLVGVIALLGGLVLGGTALGQSDGDTERRSVGKIERILGEGLITVNGRYTAAQEDMRLVLDEVVAALENSEVTLLYDNGCRYVLEENEMIRIDEQTPCVAALLQQPTGNTAGFQTLGTPSGAGAGAAAALSAIGGAGAAAAAAAGGGDDGGDNRPPLSPE